MVVPTLNHKHSATFHFDWWDKSIFWHSKSGDINAVNELNKLKIRYLITCETNIYVSPNKKNKFQWNVIFRINNVANNVI